LGPRTCNYDMLSRLTSAPTPEAQNNTRYLYYTTSGGALCSGDPSAPCTRTDARGITTTYTYDALNRLTGVSYSNGDPSAITYTYDQTACLGLSVSCYNKGRRTTMTDASGTTQWAYDAMGRVLREHRTINSVTKDTTYTYNLDGSLATLTYPSGRLVTYAPSAVGRPLSAADTTHSVTYVSGAQYAPQGALSSALFGQSGAINYSASFDNRLRPSLIYAHASADFLKLQFGFLGNSNIQTVTNDLTPGRTLNLTYDNLNRLATAQTQAASGQYCWGQSVPTDGTGYDRYGNLLKINSSQCTSPTLNLSVNTYNQITNSGFSYDNAGDMTADGVTSYVWNGAGLLKTVGSTTYTYDGDGKRVMNSAGTYNWTTPAGDQLSDTPGAGTGNEYIYFAGQRIAWVDSGGTVRYYWSDHLGTTRVITDASGNVCYDADYYPFQGERTPYVNTCTPAYRMGGMKFDQESGDYYTLNRYYPPNLGRWMSPDPLAGDITNPQSLNRYAYVLNNPATFIDPLGLQDKSNIKLQAAPSSSGCTLNGIYTACYVVASLLGAGAALPVGVPPNAELIGQWGNTFQYGWQQSPPSGYVPCSNGDPNCYREPGTDNTWWAQDHYSSATFSLPISAWSPDLPAGASNTQAGQTPQNRPSRAVQFANCVSGTLGQTVPQTLRQFGHNLAMSVKLGVPLGLGIGGAVLLSEPELLPAAPTVLAITTGQTVSTAAGASITIFSVSLATDIVAAPAFCGGNVLGF
jgi:RHS repeat-associated protein